MAAPILSTEEKAFLESLIKNNVAFMIVELTSAILQGAHVATQDIDLWIDNLGNDSFLNAVQEANGIYIAPDITGSNPPMLGPSELRIFDLVTHMHGLESFTSEYENAIDVEISGLKLKALPLERIIKSKETANREKDLASLPALRAVLALKKSALKKVTNN